MNFNGSIDFTHTQLTEPSVHVLRYGWVFWFMHRSPGEKITDYEGAMKKIATFKTKNSGLYIVTFVVQVIYQISVIIIYLSKALDLFGRMM